MTDRRMDPSLPRGQFREFAPIFAPMAELGYSFNENNNVTLKFEPTMLLNYDLEVGSYTFKTLRKSFLLSYNFSIGKRGYFITGLSATDTRYLNAFFNTAPDVPREFDFLSPHLGFGFNMDKNTAIEFNLDNIVDLYSWEVLYPPEFKIRIKKKLYGVDKTSLESNSWTPKLRFGIQFSYTTYNEYYTDFSKLSNGIFVEGALQLSNTGFESFWRRYFWTDLSPEYYISNSVITIVDNFGINYNTNYGRFGLSYLRSVETFYDKEKYMRDSIFDPTIYRFKGLSLHYQKQLTGPLHLDVQADVILNRYDFMTAWHEKCRLKFGLFIEL